MRNLTIRRNKSFVGCLVAMKVYIEDPTCFETVINGTSCRKIGELKNGKELTVEIENSEAKVFVIADKLSKGFCSDFYQLPEGDEDIFLTGQNRFNPAAGNAFIFDGNDNEDALKRRKKNTKIGIIVLIVAAIIGFAAGFLSTADIFDFKKSFAYEDMTITLTDDFAKADYDGVSTAFEAEDIAVLVTKEPLPDIEEIKNMTVKDYFELLMNGSGLTSKLEATKSGIDYFSYTSEYDKTIGEMTYTAFLFKTDDAFWMIQFGCTTEDLDEYKDKIFKWADTIQFK